MSVSYEWRGAFTSTEVNALHAAAFNSKTFDDSEWDWSSLTAKHSLGWVVARDRGELVGFVNVVWDGLVHAWIQDTMVSPTARHRGIATRVVDTARQQAQDAGCEWLHVDFDDHLRGFYFGACGFTPTNAGLIALQPDD